MFVVANVAYPALSVGKMLTNGYTEVFAPSGSFIEKNGRRVDVEQKGKTFILEGKLGTAPAIGQKIIGEQVTPVQGLEPGRSTGPSNDMDEDGEQAWA